MRDMESNKKRALFCLGIGLALGTFSCTEPPAPGATSSTPGSSTPSSRAAASTPSAAPAPPADAIKKLLEAAKAKPEEHKGKAVTVDGLFRGTSVTGFGDAATYSIAITDDKESMPELFCGGKGAPGTGDLKQFAPIRAEGKLAIGKAMRGDKEVVTVALDECKVTAR